MPPATPTSQLQHQGQQLPVISFGEASHTEPQLPPFAKVLSVESTPDPALLPSSRQPFASSQPDTDAVPVLDNSLEDAVRAVAKAKRVAVVCGAGISCASGIPDFRSSEGLFNTLKQAHPDARLSSGKDLFDANLFASESNAAIFYTMIAELRTMADNATPTPFHRLLKTLDDEGKLFRVYTQNIDGLEEKAGLSYGLGNKATPTASAIPSKQPSPTPELPETNQTPFHFSFTEGDSTDVSMHDGNETASTSSLHQPQQRPRRRSPRSISPTPSTPSTPPPFSLESLPALLPTPSTSTTTTPRCIPLHGHLATLSCPSCHSTFDLSPFLPLLRSGQSSLCPSCLKVDQTRSVLGERSRGIGKLKPDVVLYGENHKDGDRVGEITRKDLMGVRPDLLIVVGTSLKVPGTKLLVRELSKVIKPGVFKSVKGGKGKEVDETSMEMPASSQLSTISNATSTSSRRTKPKSPPIHTIYLNYEFPKPSREFQNVFDVWLRGDVQEFVSYVEKEREEMEERVRERERRKVEQAEKVRLKALEGAKSKGKGKGKVAAKKASTTTKAKGKKVTAKVAASKKPAAGAKAKKGKATPAAGKKSKAPAKAPTKASAKKVVPATTTTKGKASFNLSMSQHFASAKTGTSGGRKK